MISTVTSGGAWRSAFMTAWKTLMRSSLNSLCLPSSLSRSTPSSLRTASRRSIAVTPGLASLSISPSITQPA